MPIDQLNLTPAPSANVAENFEMNIEENCPSRQATQGPKNSFAAAKAAGATTYMASVVRTSPSPSRSPTWFLGREDAVLE